MARSWAAEIIHRMPWIDPAAAAMQKGAAALLTRDGAPTPVKSFLNGRWLGHALHATLTDIPVGAWTTTLVMDGVALSSSSEGLERGADMSLAFGVAGAVAAAVAGVADWSDTEGETRRTGMVHALLNTVALSMNVLSLVRRRRGDRAAGIALSTAAYGIASASAYLGGELVYSHGVGVSHQIWPEPPSEFTPVLEAAGLPENKLTRGRAGDVSICLLRRGNEVYAFGEWCTHLGGPLADGQLDGNLVTCPWHGSQFDVTTGAVERGPATQPAHRFTARLRAGKVEVKPEE